MTKTKARDILALILVIAALFSLLALPGTDACAAGEETRATGYCSVCGETCSYTVDYEYWTDSIHAVRRWCSNCGNDQSGGAMSEPHSYNAHGTCTKCGYYNSDYDQYLCNHPSTYITWSGCSWYEYCRNCGELVDSGTSHTYEYGEWTYSTSTRHVRTGTCTKCGAATTERGNHVRSTKYDPYDDSRHSKYTWCELCRTKLGTETLEDHTLTSGNWESFSDTQHRREKDCSKCGYEAYEYADHDFVYGNWTPVSETDHQREKTCSCGYSSSETGPHHDGDSDGLCDDCGHQLVIPFSVTVPDSLVISVSENGAVNTADNARIINNSANPVRVRSVSVSGENGWSIVPYGHSMAGEKVDSRLIGFKLNGAVTEDTAPGGYAVLQLAEGEWDISGNGEMPLSYDAVVSATSSPLNGEKVLTVCFVVGWVQ